MSNTEAPIMTETQKKEQGIDLKVEKKEKMENGGGKEVTPPSIPESPTLKHGRWSPEEKLLFLHGLQLYGKGNWKKISVFLPLRSLVQIKSHGQKVLKRAEAGEDLFAPLREKSGLVQQLVAKQASSPNFILPRLPPRGFVARSLPKPRLQPRPRPTLTFDARSTDSIQVSAGNDRTESETGSAVFKTMIGGGSLSFSFPPRQAEGPARFETPFQASDCQTPPRPDPHLIKPTTVLAATALCQLAGGLDNDAKKSSLSDDEHCVNIVSP